MSTHTAGALDDPGRSPWVLAEPVNHADAVAVYADEAVFGTAVAIQLVRGEPWLVRAVLRSVESRPPVMSRVTVEHFTQPEHEVTGTVTRDISFAAIRTQALERLRDKARDLGVIQEAGWPISSSELDAARASADAATDLLRRGPRGSYPAEHYRHIARRYLVLVKQGRRDVLKALRDEESERLGYSIKRGTLRDWVRKATRLGFLSPGTPGTPGRSPGPNLEPKEDGNA